MYQIGYAAMRSGHRDSVEFLKQLRRRFAWLCHVRYFLRYYPRGQHMKSVRLLDDQGKLLYATRGFEGELTGPMGRH